MFSKKITEKSQDYDLKLEKNKRAIEGEITEFEKKVSELVKIDGPMGLAVAISLAALAKGPLWISVPILGFVGAFLATRLAEGSRARLDIEHKNQLWKLKSIYAGCLRNHGVEATKDKTFLKLLNAIFPYMDKNTELDFLLPKKLRTPEHLKGMSDSFKAIFSDLPLFRLNDFIQADNVPTVSTFSTFTNLFSYPAAEQSPELKATALQKKANPCQKIGAYLKNVGYFSFTNAIPLIYGIPPDYKNQAIIESHKTPEASTSPPLMEKSGRSFPL